MNTMQKFILVSLMGFGFYCTISAMEKVTISQKDVVLVLEDGEEILPHDEWQAILALTGAVKELVALGEGTGEVTKVYLSSLSKDGLGLIRKHLTRIQEGGKSLEDVFDSLLSHNNTKEYIELLMAGDYLGMESVLNAFNAVLDMRAAEYLRRALIGLKGTWNDAFILAPKRLAERIVLCAAEKGKADIIELFLEDGLIDVNARGQLGMTALMYASEKGYTKIVELLLPLSPDGSLVNDLGMTALMEASMHVRTEIVELLLDHGCGGNLEQQASLCRFTPLMFASERGDVKAVALLLKHGAQVNTIRENGFETALYFAQKRGHEEVAAQLLEAGAIIVKVPEDLEEAPLF